MFIIFHSWIISSRITIFTLYSMYARSIITYICFWSIIWSFWWIKYKLWLYMFCIARFTVYDCIWLSSLSSCLHVNDMICRFYMVQRGERQLLYSFHLWGQHSRIYLMLIYQKMEVSLPFSWPLPYQHFAKWLASTLLILML